MKSKVSEHNLPKGFKTIKQISNVTDRNLIDSMANMDAMEELLFPIGEQILFYHINN